MLLTPQNGGSKGGGESQMGAPKVGAPKGAPQMWPHKMRTPNRVSKMGPPKNEGSQVGVSKMGVPEMGAPKWGLPSGGLQNRGAQKGGSKRGLQMVPHKIEAPKWQLPNGATQNGGSPRSLPSTAAEGKAPAAPRGPAAASCCQSPAGAGHSSSRAVLSRGDCSTSEFLASLRSSCCSFIFWDLARSQSVLIFSSFHTTEVSVSLM